MSEVEVAEILREIRERVRAESAARAELVSSAELNSESESTFKLAQPDEVTDALARLEANLVVTNRAWERLPPLLSYRRGLTKRLELWVKNLIKRATRWYTWEQVNFNAATNYALHETLTTLRAVERRSTEMQKQFLRAHEQSAQRFNDSQLRLEELQNEAATLRERIETLEANASFETEIAQLQFQIRETGEHILDEQRVCFKQLALETNEAATSSERVRRDLQEQVARLTREVEDLRLAIAKPDAPRRSLEANQSA